MNVHGYEIKAYADLRGVDLHRADLYDADLHGADLRNANLRNADLRNAGRRDADLHGAGLHGADLRGANLDYSCWPLWCGSKEVKLDSEQIDQLCLHLYWVAGTAIGNIEKRAQRAAAKRHVQL